MGHPNNGVSSLKWPGFVAGILVGRIFLSPAAPDSRRGNSVAFGLDRTLDRIYEYTA
jgi:hypothetical protein